MESMVTNVYAKSNYDQLRNNKALGTFLKRTKTITFVGFVAIRGPSRSNNNVSDGTVHLAMGRGCVQGCSVQSVQSQLRAYGRIRNQNANPNPIDGCHTPTHHISQPVVRPDCLLHCMTSQPIRAV